MATTVEHLFDAFVDEQSVAPAVREQARYEQLAPQAGDNDDDADDGKTNFRSMGLPRRRGWICLEIPVGTFRRRVGRARGGTPASTAGCCRWTRLETLAWTAFQGGGNSLRFSRAEPRRHGWIRGEMLVRTSRRQRWTRLEILVNAPFRSGAGSSSSCSPLRLSQRSQNVYAGQCGGILDAPQDLHDTFNAQLKHTQNKDTSNLFMFETSKLPFEDEAPYDKEEIAEARASVAASSGKGAATVDDLEAISRDPALDAQELGSRRVERMATAETFEAEVNRRPEELRALVEAGIVTENTSGADSLVHGLS